MSLASYQLLHSAIISIRLSSRLRCKDRHFFVHHQDLGEKKWKKIAIATILQYQYYRNAAETPIFAIKRQLFRS
jgi:hypothetical protein